MNIKNKIKVISGAGNTFGVILENESTLQISNRPEWVIKICSQINVDGFIFIQKISNDHFGWDFYNNDGSIAEMCGNATRCVGYYIQHFLNNFTNHFIQLQTIAGPIQVKSLGSDIFQVRMTPILEKIHTMYFWCDTGVPHIVIEIDKFEKYKELKQWAKQLRWDPSFLPTGTNVTLIHLGNEKDCLQAVSYERGVEDFTSACGTGAMAAAYYNYKKRNSLNSLVEMPGGILKMNLQDLNSPLMTGTAELIHELELKIE